MNKQSVPLTIGRLAKATQVTIETIRYYQRLQLMTEPAKPFSGFRHYPTSDIQRLCFIKRAQHLGFSLKEVAQLLELGEKNCADVKSLASIKRDKVAQQITGLIEIKSALDTLITTCNTRDNSAHCGIIDALSDPK